MSTPPPVQQQKEAQRHVILDVQRLRKHFPIRRGLLRRVVGHVRAVDDVSFELARGETLSLVGESVCGKTTTSRCILRAIQPTAGAIRFRTDDDHIFDVAELPKRELRPLRRKMQMIFQDPFSFLNPRMTIADIIAEPLLVNGMGSLEQRRQRVRDLLDLLHLPAAYMNRFPHALSGGQRQRSVSRGALALNPALIVADEPVSTLDVSVQAQIVNLLLELQDRLDLLPIRRPRSERRQTCQRSGRGHVCRPHRRDCRDDGVVHGAQASLHLGTAVSGADPGPPQAFEADHFEGQSGRFRPSPFRLLLALSGATDDHVRERGHMASSKRVKAFFEPKIEPHEPDLYAYQGVAHGIAAADATAAIIRERFDERGFALICGLMPSDKIGAARHALGAMTLSDQPECEMIWYEGGLRDHLALSGDDDQETNGSSAADGLVLGQSRSCRPRP